MSALAPIVPARSSAWLLRGASMPGERHLADGVPSQDAFTAGTYSSGEREVVVLAVADGAGSAPRSAEGAAIAVGSVRDAARGWITDGLPQSGADWRVALEGIASEAFERLHAAAGTLSKVRDFGCTLAVALISEPWIALLTVGDAFAIVRRADGGLHLPLVPVHPDGDPTRTFLLSQPDALERMEVTVIEDPDVAAVALASDGLDRAALIQVADRARPYPPFVNPLIEHARAGDSSAPLAEFLLANHALAETTDDDRTLVLAVRR